MLKQADTDRCWSSGLSVHLSCIGNTKRYNNFLHLTYKDSYTPEHKHKLKLFPIRLDILYFFESYELLNYSLLIKTTKPDYMYKELKPTYSLSVFVLSQLAGKISRFCIISCLHSVCFYPRISLKPEAFRFCKLPSGDRHSWPLSWQGHFTWFLGQFSFLSKLLSVVGNLLKLQLLWIFHCAFLRFQRFSPKICNLQHCISENWPTDIKEFHVICQLFFLSYSITGPWFRSKDSNLALDCSVSQDTHYLPLKILYISSYRLRSQKSVSKFQRVKMLPQEPSEIPILVYVIITKCLFH